MVLVSDVQQSVSIIHIHMSILLESFPIWAFTEYCIEFLCYMLLLLLLLLSHFSHVRLCHRWQPTRLLSPWDSPGKNTGVDCYFLLQCMKVKSESEVAQSCPTLSKLMDCSLPGSSIHGILQARVLEWVAIAFSPVLYSRSLLITRLYIMGFPCGSAGKESTCNVGDWVRSLGWEDLLEKVKATHSSILAWRIPWTV